MLPDVVSGEPVAVAGVGDGVVERCLGTSSATSATVSWSYSSLGSNDGDASPAAHLASARARAASVVMRAAGSAATPATARSVLMRSTLTFSQATSTRSEASPMTAPRPNRTPLDREGAPRSGCFPMSILRRSAILAADAGTPRHPKQPLRPSDARRLPGYSEPKSPGYWRPESVGPVAALLRRVTSGGRRRCDGVEVAVAGNGPILVTNRRSPTVGSTRRGRAPWRPPRHRPSRCASRRSVTRARRGSHASDAGYAVWADVVLAVVAEHLRVAPTHRPSADSVSPEDRSRSALRQPRSMDARTLTPCDEQLS